jgi:membrane associated rhomboid family serine protease
MTNPARERVFNVPGVVLALAALLVLIQLALAYLLTTEQTNHLLLTFAFIPLRYVATNLPGEELLTGWAPKVWSFVSYAFIHVNLNHLIFNLLWLLAFGPPIARRFGAVRFLLFYLATAAAGALAFLVSHWSSPGLMIGASASVSGAMAAAMRFVFQRGGPLGMIGSPDEASYHVPAAPLTVMLRDPRILAFLAVWFGVNLLFGIGAVTMPGLDGGTIAWEAHVGGFLAGLLAFSLFDPVRPPPSAQDSPPITINDAPIDRE